MRRFLIFLVVLLFAASAKAQPYVKGYYYNISGQKISGLIKFMPNWDYIHIKADQNASSDKVKIKDISSIVMMYGGLTGTDSLTVLTEDNKENKRYFAKFHFATPVTKFYSKFESVSSGGAPSMSTLSNVPSSTGGGSHSITHWSNSSVYYGTEQLTMYSDGNTTHELTKKNYIEVLSKAFADVPDVVQQIQSNKYKFKQLGDIIIQYQSQSNYKGN